MPRGENQSQDEEAPRVFSDRPHRCVQRSCPFIIRWLDVLHYGDALVVKDLIHVSLYLMTGVSLACIVLWCFDICSGDCFMPTTWSVKSLSAYRCIYEAVGAIIFFGSIRDSVLLIASYDSNHRQLLARKRQLMSDLKSETVEVLEKAEGHCQEFSNMLLDTIRTKIGEHVFGFFDNTLNLVVQKLSLDDAGSTEKRSLDDALLNELTTLIGQNLDEPGRAAAVYFRKLSVLQDLRSAGIEAKPVVTASERKKKFWIVWKRQYERAGSVPPSTSTNATSRPQTTDVDQEIMHDPGNFVLKPVMDMINQIQYYLAQPYIQEVKKEDSGAYFEQGEQSALFGCGTPPWDTATCGIGCGCHAGEEADRLSCCVPHCCATMAKCFVSCLCCCCCCCCQCCCPSPSSREVEQGRQDRRCCDVAYKYPKRVRIGCFWFEIVSNLHERLLIGLILTTAYCGIYGWVGFESIATGGRPKISVVNPLFWAWLWELLRNSIILVALLFNVPTKLACIFNIRRLDPIIKINEDISKLKDIQRLVNSLERSVHLAGERKGLLEAIQDRVMPRIQCVDQFRRVALKKEHDPPEVIRGMTAQLVACLEESAESLLPIAKWLDLPQDQRQEKVNEAKEKMRAYEHADFEPQASTFRAQSGDWAASSNASGSSAGLPLQDRRRGQ